MFCVTFHEFPNFVYAHSLTMLHHQFSNRNYSFFEIVYVTGGVLHMVLGGREYTAREGDCVVIPPGTEASCKSDERAGRHSHLSVGVQLRLSVSPNISERRLGEFSFCCDTHQTIQDGKGFQVKFEELIKAYGHGELDLAMCLYLQLCTMLQSNVSEHRRPESGDIYARKILDYLNNNYTRRISIPKIASYLSITPEYASERFKAATGMTIIDYVNRRKIERAKGLLRSGGISIQYAGLSVGIENMSYFSRLFKKYEGVSPNEFRYSLQREYIDYQIDTAGK